MDVVALSRVSSQLLKGVRAASHLDNWWMLLHWAGCLASYWRGFRAASHLDNWWMLSFRVNEWTAWTHEEIPHILRMQLTIPSISQWRSAYHILIPSWKPAPWPASSLPTCTTASAFQRRSSTADSCRPCSWSQLHTHASSTRQCCWVERGRATSSVRISFIMIIMRNVSDMWFLRIFPDFWIFYKSPLFLKEERKYPVLCPNL